MGQFIENEPRVLRPLNFAKTAPGVGARVFSDASGRKVLVTQVLGQVFMKRPFADPFSALETVFRAHPLGGAVQAAIVDVRLRGALARTGRAVAQGGAVSSGLRDAGLLTAADLAIVAAGEAAGRLDESLARVAASAGDRLADGYDLAAEWLPRLVYLAVVALIAHGLIGG